MRAIASHATARTFHQLTEGPITPDRTLDVRPYHLPGAPSAEDAEYVRIALWRFGISEEHIKDIHLMVFNKSDRRQLTHTITHYQAFIPSHTELIAAGNGVYIVDIRLCALQAATYLTFRELVEYYFEICGNYALSLEPSRTYRKRPALSTVEDLSRYFKVASGRHGAKRARRAISYTRAGSRSPMETALVMLLVMPKKEGGLGIRGVLMDHRVEVTRRARALTRRRHFYFDAYLPASQTDLEYNGLYHEEEIVQAIDEERRNALDAMGYAIITVNRHALFDAMSFQRAMAKIMRLERISPSDLPCDFSMRQESLWTFVLRNCRN